MRNKGLLILLIISLGINVGAGGYFTFYFVRKANPKYRWTRWMKKYDETWQMLETELELAAEETEKVRGHMREGFEQSKEYWDGYRIIRDSLIHVMSQPELDTNRLKILLEKDESLQTQTGYDMYLRLFEAKSMLPADKQEAFIEYYKASIYFTGQPWYIAEYKEWKPKENVQ